MISTRPVGQTPLIDFLKRIKAKRHLSHAYLFCGPEGIGKKTMARYFTQLLLCDAPAPCGTCKACTLTGAGTNPDVVTVSPEGKASIGVDKIRSLIREVYIKPSICRYKVFLIEQAHLLTPEAQNALLKVVEEPPEYAVFLLLCSNLSLLLPTIRSRVVTLRVLPLKNEALEQIANVSDPVLEAYAAGNPGRYLKLLSDDELKSLRNGLFDALPHLLSNDRFEIYPLLAFFESGKERRDTLFEILISFFRDVLFERLSCSEYAVNRDHADLVREFSQTLTLRASYGVLNTVQKAQRELGKYGAYTLHVHAMLIKCWEEIHG